MTKSVPVLIACALLCMAGISQARVVATSKDGYRSASSPSDPPPFPGATFLPYSVYWKNTSANQVLSLPHVEMQQIYSSDINSTSNNKDLFNFQFLEPENAWFLVRFDTEFGTAKWKTNLCETPAGSTCANNVNPSSILYQPGSESVVVTLLSYSGGNFPLFRVFNATSGAAVFDPTVPPKDSGMYCEALCATKDAVAMKVVNPNLNTFVTHAAVFSLSTGELLWKFTTQAGSGAGTGNYFDHIRCGATSVSISKKASKGVFVFSGANTNGTVTALDGTSGNVIWQTTLSGSAAAAASSSGLISVVDVAVVPTPKSLFPSVFALGDQGEQYILNVQNGKTVWKHNADGNATFTRCRRRFTTLPTTSIVLSVCENDGGDPHTLNLIAVDIAEEKQLWNQRTDPFCGEVLNVAMATFGGMNQAVVSRAYVLCSNYNSDAGGYQSVQVFDLNTGAPFAPASNSTPVSGQIAVGPLQSNSQFSHVQAGPEPQLIVFADLYHFGSLEIGATGCAGASGSRQMCAEMRRELNCKWCADSQECYDASAATCISDISQCKNASISNNNWPVDISTCETSPKGLCLECPYTEECIPAGDQSRCCVGGLCPEDESCCLGAGKCVGRNEECCPGSKSGVCPAGEQCVNIGGTIQCCKDACCGLNDCDGSCCIICCPGGGGCC